MVILMPKNRNGMAYTRVEYIHRRPQLKIRRFSMGEPSNDYAHVVSLVSAFPAKIGGGALESARITANKVLEANTGISYFLKIAVYPHEIIREHKLMGFAGADRLSQGMSRSVGKATKRAARVSANQPILTVFTNKDGIDVAKTALRRASKKLPISCKIIVKESS
jgi:large subunit ribosomal protein L10e